MSMPRSKSLIRKEINKLYIPKDGKYSEINSQTYEEKCDD